MKKYTSLKSIFYSDKSSNKVIYNDFLNTRLNNELIVYSGLKMSPFDSKKEIRDVSTSFEIFFLPTVQISILKDKIYKNSSLITYYMSKLPDVASDQLFYNTLVLELQSTNDIEGIRSSRKEIGEAINNVITKSQKSNMRFEGLVNQYINIKKGNFNEIKSVKEFRSIWDELVGEEEKDDVPDGNLFRRQPEYIMDGSKTVHAGDVSEEQITQNLTKLVYEMNNHDIPALERCFIAHYYYEYIHPFYDGNGRTGRYIACSYLARKLDIMTAVSFSSAISLEKKRYYKPFMDMSKFFNYGDATNFIIRMLEILEEGQTTLLKRIQTGFKLLNDAEKRVSELKSLNDEEKSVIFILYQKYIFGTYAPELTDNDLKEILHLSTYKIRNITNNLKKLGYIDLIKEKPKVHYLSQKLSKDIPTLH